MKLVFLFGAGAVGKMTVGRALMAQTGLRLFHNHMTLEPVLEVFGTPERQVVNRLRDVFFEAFAASDRYGMIFTYMWAFDCQEDWDYIEHVQSLFRPYGTEFYFVELVAPLAVRLERNATAERLAHKPSKRDVASSARRLQSEEAYRLESLPGEIPFENYLRLDTADLPPEEAARRIRERFGL